MIGSWTIGAQLSTSHLSLAALDEQRMLDGVRDVLEAIELDLLIIGFREAPEVFRRFCAADRPVENVCLWFSALSDTAGMTEEDLIVDWRGARSRGWGGWAGKGGDVEETFRFACPNNPVVRERTTLHLRELLHRYDFKGQCQSNRVRRCCRPSRRLTSTIEVVCCRITYAHAAVFNTFNVQRHLTSASTHRTFRAAAISTWRKAVTAT
jgi:hypothetical protein